jgi:hypothetical protein
MTFQSFFIQYHFTALQWPGHWAYCPIWTMEKLIPGMDVVNIPRTGTDIESRLLPPTRDFESGIPLADGVEQKPEICMRFVFISIKYQTRNNYIQVESMK